MDSSREESSSDEWEVFMDTNDNHHKNNYQHHSKHQIQRLEAYFNECPKPDNRQRRKLSEELNLKPKQIKFWFQNKRTQAKNYHQKAENAALRAENMKFIAENEAMDKALRTVFCPPCGGRNFGREAQLKHLQELRSKNEILKKQVETLSKNIAQHRAKSIPSVDGLLYHHDPSSYGLTSSNRHGAFGTSSNHLPGPSSLSREPSTSENINISPPPMPRNPLLMQHARPLSILENMAMVEIAAKALEEVEALILIEEPLWTKSSIDGRLVIDQGKYKDCSKFNNLNDPSGHRESSKEVVVVHMDARKLVDMFMDTEKWARLFPTIVNEAKTIQVLYSTEKPEEPLGRVIYEELHILSPLVPPREFIVLRSFHHKEKENLWVIADVSCHPPNIDFEFNGPISTKRPSGVVIQPLPDGRSKVSWVEHVEVNDKVRPHRLYRELLNSGFGYGARRWTATLERMCERLCLYSIPEFLPIENAGVVKRIEGKRSVMNLGERMLKNFAWIMKMSEKLDFSQQSETNNTGVRISVRRNTEAGQPTGLIVCASSSLNIPVPPLHVYNFLRNLEIRYQWDVLCHGKPVTEATRFVTGKDQKNNVNFLKPARGGENSELMILQDGFIDALGGMVVYAPLDLNSANSAISGEVESSTIAILPSGFIISRDSRPFPGDLDGSRMTLLTVAFQILVSGPTYSSGLPMEESISTVNTLVSSTVQRIKAMLNCNDGQ